MNPSSSSSLSQFCSVPSHEFTKTELEEMVASACRYDDIDPKLQMIMIRSFTNMKYDDDNFEQLLEKNNIRHMFSAKKIKNFELVKNPQFGWGPNNHNHYLSIPEEIALKIKVLGYLG